MSIEDYMKTKVAGSYYYWDDEAHQMYLVCTVACTVSFDSIKGHSRAVAIGRHDTGERRPFSHIVWHQKTGQWPPDGMVVDHIDGNPMNNHFNNLRLLTLGQNSWNAEIPLGRYPGISYSKQRDKFIVRSLGAASLSKKAKSFDNLSEAMEMAVAVRRNHPWRWCDFFSRPGVDEEKYIQEAKIELQTQREQELEERSKLLIVTIDTPRLQRRL